MRRFELTSLATIALALASSATAQAGSFMLREQSTIGLGQAFAGAAAGQAGLGSMYWNPATMTAAPGLQIEGTLNGIFPYANVKPETGTSPILLRFNGDDSSGDVASDAALPAGYASYQLGDRIWIGVGANSSFGLTTSYPDDFAGKIYARSSEVRSYNINPNVAVEVNDWLSIGAGLQVQYFKTELTQSLSPLPNAPGAKLEGDDWGVGFTAGLTLKPFDGTEIGVGYRSSVTEKLDGSLNFGAAQGRLPAGSYAVGAEIDLPYLLSVGIHQAITPDFALNAGFEWANWSRFGTIPVVGKGGFTNGRELTDLPFEYKDGYYASLGGDYRWNDTLTLRAGAGYEWSPIDTGNRDLRLPDSDRVHVNAGLGYKWNEKLSFDLAYSHIFTVGDGDIELKPGNPHYTAGTPTFVGSVDSHVDIVAVGLTYRFDAGKLLSPGT